MSKNYRHLFLYEWESLPAGIGISPDRFSSLRIVRRGGVLTLLLALHGKDYNPFEMYDEGAVEIAIPCPDVFGRGHGEALPCATTGGSVSRNDLARVIRAARNIAHWQEGFEIHVVETRFGACDD